MLKWIKSLFVKPVTISPAGLSVDDFSELVTKHFAVCFGNVEPPDDDVYWTLVEAMNADQSAFLGGVQLIIESTKQNPTVDVESLNTVYDNMMDFRLVNAPTREFLDNYVTLARQDLSAQDKRDGEKRVMRNGEAVAAGAAFDAWTSADLPKMLAAMDAPAHPIDRHHLLQSIVGEAYKDRKNEASRDILFRVAQIHLDEFPKLAPKLKSHVGFMPRVSTFQHYATALSEVGDFKKAVDVCRLAIEYDLHDGTQSGYEGRIERLEKKALQSSKQH